MTKSFFSLLLPNVLLPLSLLIATPCALAQSAAAPQTASVDRIVAVVDDDVILKSELDRAELNVKQQYTGHTAQLPPEDVLQKQVLERLVTERVLLQYAKETGIRI